MKLLIGYFDAVHEYRQTAINEWFLLDVLICDEQCFNNFKLAIDDQ